MTLAALAASSALTSITTVSAAPRAASPAPASTDGAPAPAFNKLLDRARTSDEGAAKDETALPKGTAADADDGDTDAEAATDNVVTLATTATPTPSPDALTAAAGEGVTAVLALIQMANAAMTPPLAAAPATVTLAVTTTPMAPTVATPTITAPIVDTTPIALTNAPAALQQVLTQASAEAPAPAIVADQPTIDLADAPADIELPQAAATVVTLLTRATAPLDTATVLAALKARAVVIDAESAPQQPVVAMPVATTETAIVANPTPVQSMPVTVPTPVAVAVVPAATETAAPAVQADVAQVIAPTVQTPAPSAAISEPTVIAPAAAPAKTATPIVVASASPTAPIAVVLAPVAAPVQPATTPAAAPVTVAAAMPRPATARIDDRAEPAKTEAPRANMSKDDAAPVADVATPADPLPSNVAAVSERAVRAEATPQAATPAPVDNQPVERHLDLARDTQWLDQLTRDINMAAATNGQLKFQLNPERLGALTVEIANSANGASIKFTADSVDAQKIIADAQPRLVAEARQQGLTIAETKVDLSNQRSNGGNATTNGQSQQQSGQQSSQDAKHSMRSTSMMREEPAESATREDDNDLYA